MLLTQYAGTKSVFVYSHITGDDPEGTKAGYLTIDDPDVTGVEANNVPLKSEGMFYRAGAVDAEAALVHSAVVGAAAKPTEVFSYTDPTDDTETKQYVVLTEDREEPGDTTVTTYTYALVDVTSVFRDKNGLTEVPVDGGSPVPNERKVKASIPAAADYKHIHFGVWAALGEAAKDGSQKIADLGIGFVQNWSGEGLTVVDMPNNGTADYSGNWVATVREADDDGDGDISLTSGPASLSADFTKAAITADLSGLAKLEGAIDNNTFSGTKATVGAGSGLEAGGTFMGTFSGGFYGDKAAEAGGVFDFTSDGATAGEFRGAFGGDRK